MARQEIYTAILLKATDYRENDKLVRLLTLECGVITAVMKGVKKNGAKLKFGAQQFAFCEYTVVYSGNFGTVTGCTQLEDLFSLTSDADKFFLSSLLLECSDIATSQTPNPQIFILLLKCLKEMLYGNQNDNITAIYFIQKVLFFCGYINGEEAAGISKVSKFLSLILTSELSALPVEDDDIIKESLKQIIRIFEDSFSVKLKSAKFITN